MTCRAQESGGYRLLAEPGELDLLRIYRAVSERGEVHFLDIHQNPGDDCIVGRHIRPTLEGLLGELDEAIARELQSHSLLECIGRMGEDLTPWERQALEGENSGEIPAAQGNLSKKTV